MPWYGYIHPAAALFTLVYGIRTAQLSMSKVEDWDFPLRRIRTQTVLFTLFCVVNLVLGFVGNAIMAGVGKQVRLSGHIVLAIGIVVLAILAAVTTFTRSRKPGEVSPYMKFHGWAIAVALAAMLAMLFTAILKLFGV